jgi:hypothetical protein
VRRLGAWAITTKCEHRAIHARVQEIAGKCCRGLCYGRCLNARDEGRSNVAGEFTSILRRLVHPSLDCILRSHQYRRGYGDRNPIRLRSPPAAKGFFAPVARNLGIGDL